PDAAVKPTPALHQIVGVCPRQSNEAVTRRYARPSSAVSRDRLELPELDTREPGCKVRGVRGIGAHGQGEAVMTRFSIYFATDIHGSEHCFRKFLNAGKFYGVNAVILGGDIAGKGLVPIVEGPDGTWVVTFFGTPVHLESEDQVKDLERRLRTQGLYAYRTTPDEAEQIATDDEHLDRPFQRVIAASV